MRCLECSKAFSARTNKKFCSDRCRVAYNRHKKRNSSDTATEDRVILSLCDYSGVWSLPYKEAGYNVCQVDIKLGQDLRLLRHPGRVWGVLAAPPCTVFSLAGNRHHRTESEWLEALSVVDACLRLIVVASPQWWALENPRGKLVHYLGKPRFEFEPYWYGSPWSKRTCLWGEFTVPEPSPVERTHSLHNSVRSPELRAKTPESFARAFFNANP